MRRLLVLALVFGASACDSGPDFTGFGGLSRDPARLVGTWEWARTYTCGDGAPCTETTPKSAGAAEALVVSADSLSGYFDRRTVPAPVGYRAERGQIRLDVISVKGEPLYAFGVSDARLVIGYTYVDGVRYETTYRRAR